MIQQKIKAFVEVSNKDEYIFEKIYSQFAAYNDKIFDFSLYFEAKKIGINTLQQKKVGIKSSNINIFLVSPDLIIEDVDICDRIDKAKDRYEKLKIPLIPINCRDSVFFEKGAIFFDYSNFIIPSKENPIISKKWDSIDEPYKKVVADLRLIGQSILNNDFNFSTNSKVEEENLYRLNLKLANKYLQDKNYLKALKILKFCKTELYENGFYPTSDYLEEQIGLFEKLMTIIEINNIKKYKELIKLIDIVENHIRYYSIDDDLDLIIKEIGVLEFAPNNIQVQRGIDKELEADLTIYPYINEMVEKPSKSKYCLIVILLIIVQIIAFICFINVVY